MFTGIVEEMGSVSKIAAAPDTGVTMIIKGSTVLEGAYQGCSIAVNGVCLTVTDFDASQFTVRQMPLCTSFGTVLHLVRTWAIGCQP